MEDLLVKGNGKKREVEEKEEYIPELKVLRSAKFRTIYEVTRMSIGDVITAINRILIQDNGMKENGYMGISPQYDNESKMPQLYLMFNTQRCDMIHSANNNNFNNMAPAARALLGNSRIEADPEELLEFLDGKFIINDDDFRVMSDSGNAIIPINLTVALFTIYGLDATNQDGGNEFISLIDIERASKLVDTILVISKGNIENAEYIGNKYSRQNYNQNKKGRRFVGNMDIG